MAKYTPITQALSEYLFEYIDRLDWGEKNILTGDLWRTNVKEKLLAGFRPGNYPTRITRTHIQAHLAKEKIYYYNSDRKSDVALLCIDIDAHDHECGKNVGKGG